jgi:hypothetical protein
VGYTDLRPDRRVNSASMSELILLQYIPRPQATTTTSARLLHLRDSNLIFVMTTVDPVDLKGTPFIPAQAGQ